jgi:hypothetical protein
MDYGRVIRRDIANFAWGNELPETAIHMAFTEPNESTDY